MYGLILFSYVGQRSCEGDNPDTSSFETVIESIE